MATAIRRTGWRKSSYSNQANGCVEVDFTSGGAQIRDSKLAESPVIAFTTEQWSAWLTEVTTDHLTNTNGAVTVTVSSNTWTVRSLDTGHTLVFGETEWTAFRLGVTDGEFNRFPRSRRPLSVK